MKRLLVALAVLFAAPAHASTPPSFSIDDATAAEDSGTIVFRVRKHGHLNNLPSIINVYGLDGTAKFGSDFDSVNQSVTFAPGETVKLVAIHLINDNVPEPTETFTVKLHAVSNARLYDGTAIGTITDSDVAAPPLPSWVAAPLTSGGYAKAIAAEQAVPKESPYSYGEADYRTVQAGETVRLGASFPDCACAPREWAVSGLDGRFIGYLWEANLSGVAPAP